MLQLLFFLTENNAVSSSAVREANVDLLPRFVKEYSKRLVMDLNELDRWADSGVYTYSVIMYSAAVPINPKYKTVR